MSTKLGIFLSLWKPQEMATGISQRQVFVLSKNETHAQTLKVFPNRVKDFLNVHGIRRGEIIKICNTSGSLMKQSTVKNGGVSTQDLPKGMYLIKTDKAIQKVVKK